MKIDVYEETYAGTIFLGNRVLHPGNQVRYGKAWWFVTQSADGMWILGRKV